LILYTKNMGDFEMFFRKIRYIPQVDERDCGVTALAMVLANYKTYLSLAKLRYIAKTDIE